MTYEKIKAEYRDQLKDLTFFQMLKFGIMARWYKSRSMFIAELVFLGLFIVFTLAVCFDSLIAAIVPFTFTIFQLNVMLSNIECQFAYLTTDLALDYCKYMDTEFEKMSTMCKDLVHTAELASTTDEAPQEFKGDAKAPDEKVPECDAHPHSDPNN